MFFIRNIFLGLTITALILAVSCKDDPNEVENPTVPLVFQFVHAFGDQNLIYDSLMYINEANNKFEVTEIQWFISDLILHGEEGVVVIQTDENIHYVDTNIPETLIWIIDEEIPVDEYSQLSLTFGLKDENNTVGRFTDPPEVNMVWPYHMGGDYGGYHYMKLNGFWLDLQNERKSFNFHLGVGSVTDENGNTEFIQNWFETVLPIDPALSTQNDTLVVPVFMNVENWFRNPHTWDHNNVGPKIMKNQSAMRMGIENGMSDVFSVGTSEIGNQ